MKLLLDNGAAVLRNGMPVYVRDDGREIEFDGAQAFAKIGQLTGENTAYKKRYEEAEAFAKPFKDAEITDFDEVTAALELKRNVKEGQLVAAGKVEEIKANAIKAAQEQEAGKFKAVSDKLKAIETERDSFRDGLYDEKIGGHFSRSKFITEKCDTPGSLLRGAFGAQFKIEDGKTVPYDFQGNKIYSLKRPGEVADFDEGMEMLVHAHPDRERILKGSGASGGGASSSGGAMNGGKKTYTRAQFDAADPIARQSIVAEAGSGKAVITD